MADGRFDGYGTLGFARPGGIVQCESAAEVSALADYYNSISAHANRRPYDPVFAQKAAPAAPTKEPDVATNDSLIPDISLARVLKWAVVLLIAMALGRKVWDQFGDKITKQMHKALDAAT